MLVNNAWAVGCDGLMVIFVMMANWPYVGWGGWVDVLSLILWRALLTG